MRTMYLILSFLVCFVLCLSGQSESKSANQLHVRKTTPVFHVVKVPGTDQYQVVQGQMGLNKVVFNLVSTKEVLQDNRKLASLGNEAGISYQLEVVKKNIQNFSKRDLNNLSLQLQYVAP